MRTERGPLLLLLCSVGLAAVLLAPVALAPVHADDRYWYLMIAARSEGSLLELLRWTYESLPAEISSGRIATLAAVERRVIGLGAIEASVATGVPVVMFQALVKYSLAAASILAVLAMVRSLRWRTSDGSLARVRSSRLWLVAIALPLAVAAGAQAQSQFRNGWTSYAVLTWGAAAAIFGSVAALLWLTRLTAENLRRYSLPSVLVLVALAGATTISYELILPGVVVAAAALLVTPVTDRDHRGVGRRAKAITGSAYFGAFIVLFASARLYLNDLCSREECYAGVTPNLGSQAAKTAVFNLVTALSIGGAEENLADLRRIGWESRYPLGTTWWSLLIAVLIFVVLLTAWWLAQRQRHGVSDPVLDRAEGWALAVGSGLAALAAIGTSAVMAISVQAQEVVDGFGLPYRNTMVTWTSIATAGVLAAAAAGLAFGPRTRAIPWVAVTAVVATLAATTLPTDLMVTRAFRALPELQATEAVHQELALGETTRDAEARRCEVLSRVEQEMGANSTVERIERYANRAFQHYHGEPFCGDGRYAQ